MNTVSIRYIVNDVDESLSFYSKCLGFKVEMNPAPGFAMLSKDALRLLLNAPGAGGAGAAMRDGTMPEPGGWNRFQLLVDDLDAEIVRLRECGATFYSDIIAGNGGKQILLQDPSGNLIELLEPRKRD